MPTHKITGQLLTTNQLPLPGLKVSVWDKDKKVSDHLGTAYSDAKGQFSISFEDAQFFDGIEDSLPDVFFLVYQGDRVIHSTEGKPIKNAKDLKNVVLIVGSEDVSVVPETIATYSVQGTILNKQSKTPLPDMKVEAWDKDKKVNDQLGMTITDEKGSFFIQYDASRFRDDSTDHLPDVFFRIYRGELMVYSTEAKPLKIVTQQKDIKIEIAFSPEVDEPEIPNFPKKTVLDLSKNGSLTVKELQKKQPKVYATIKEKAQQDLQKTTATFFEKASYDLRFFARTMDFKSLAKEDDSVKEYVESTIENSNLPKSQKKEARSRLAKWDGPKTLNELIQPEKQIKENPLFQPELQQANVFHITEMAGLDTKIAEALIAKKMSLYNIGPNSVKELVADKLISKKQGEVLNLNANVYTLARGNLKLSEAIKNHNPNRQLRSFVDLAALDEADWKTILKKSKVIKDKEALEKQAQLKQRQVEILFPHEVFKARSKKSETRQLKPLMNKFYKANATLNFLDLNYNEDSEDLQNIKLDSFTKDEQTTILNNLKTNQRLYSITKNATDTLLLKTKYSSGHKMAFDSLPKFIETTGLEPSVAKNYHKKALQKAVNLNIALGNMVDANINPLSNSMVGGSTREAQNYLRRLNGYEEFFGETDYCKCKHCASIISPIAYFADLMEFLDGEVLSQPMPFGSEGNPQSILSPKVRRPDLWSGLKLNCENTHGLVPYLTIINEILENFIYTQYRGIFGLPDRNTIENYIYGRLSQDDEDIMIINSIHQPFHLPLMELDTYLEHFPITRASIAKTLLADVPDDNNILPQVSLGLSNVSYQLLLTDRANDEINSDANREFLQQLYDIQIPETGSVSELEVQQLMAVLDINRTEFTELLESNFIFPRIYFSSSEVKVKGGKKDGSLQVNVEYIVGINQFHFDRMHRFIRLWRQLDWSILELDQIVSCLNLSHNKESSPYLYPEQIIKLVRLQKELKISVDELCILIYQIPGSGTSSFFDQRFNLSTFVKEESDRWSTANLTSNPGDFQHPNYRTAPITRIDKTKNTLVHRLLAGLGINDEELFLLIKNLLIPLDVAADRTFTINHLKITLLYRHALILKRYKLKVEEMFLLLGIIPAIPHNYLKGWRDVAAFVDLIDWQKNSNYSLAELAFVLEEPLGEKDQFQDAGDISQAVWTQIQTDESLLFADTLFSYVEGISEEQSRRIIRANSTVIKKADLRKFSLSKDARLSDTFSLIIPNTITNPLTEEQRIEVVGTLLNLIANLLVAPVAVSSATNVLETINGISVDDALLILDGNNQAFELVAGDYQLSALVRNNPSAIGLNIPATIWDALDPDEKQELYSTLVAQISKYIQPGSPELSDRIFVGIANLDLAQSRELVTTNSTLFDEIKGETMYWLGADFNSNTLIKIPANIPLPESKAQEMLLAKHVGQIIQNILAGILGISNEKVKVLGKLGGYDFNTAILSTELTRFAQDKTSLEEFEDIIKVLQKLTVWFKDKNFDPDTLDFIGRHSGDNDQVFKMETAEGFRLPNITHLQETERYRKLRKEVGDEVDEFHNILTNYDFKADTPMFGDLAVTGLANMLKLDNRFLQTANEVSLFPNKKAAGKVSNEALKALHKYKEIIALVQYLGIGPETLPLFISKDFNDLEVAVQSVVTAIRTKYDTEAEWEEKIGPFEDNIRERKRDALTDYLIRTFPYDDKNTLKDEQEHWFKSTHDLYNYFLIDTELEGCARTSRVVAGISSLQLYIQRCLLNLEQSEDGLIHVLPEYIPANQWEWRKNYRVWEANRKVFLYPENYIEPDLRDNKTELFKELESTLLQQEINTQHSEEAYAKYMKGFDEVAKLKIAGSYHDLGNMNVNNLDTQPDTLHLFGVTASDPPIYYYRTIENLRKEGKSSGTYGTQYGSWKKLSLQIPVKKVSPIIYGRRLYLFWVEISTRPENSILEGSSRFNGYKHTMRIKFSIKNADDTWSTTQEVILSNVAEFPNGNGVILDPLFDSTELTEFWRGLPSITPPTVESVEHEDEEIGGTLNVSHDPGTLEQQNRYRNHALLNKMYKLVNNEPELLESDDRILIFLESEDKEDVYNIGINFSDSKVRNLFIPKYDSNIHREPEQDYTLKGYEWDRIYPTIGGNGIYLANKILANNTKVLQLKTRILNIPSADWLSGFNMTIYNRFYQPSHAGRDSDRTGSLHYISGGAGYSYYSAERILRTGELNPLLFKKQVRIIERSRNDMEVHVINGLLQNAIIEHAGDSFLLYQHTFKSDSPYILRRLGTTLADDMVSTLYNNRLNGLLNIANQKRLKENSVPFNFLPGYFWNDAKKAVDIGIPDFKGSLGTYFREIFFHIPSLIANHINSQNKFADAQQWYHYIFNPTGDLSSSESIELRDFTDTNERQRIMAKRVWQFIEFRNHTLANWRKQLNDPQAISAYENDPFNPHAIARLRLGAYMKNITMKYIDNLLDWGDHLFAQDTMESINEATLLYTMASEILGQRPVEVGDCVQETENLTFIDLQAKLDGPACSDFLNGVETVISEPSAAASRVFMPNIGGNDILEAEYGAIGEIVGRNSNWSEPIPSTTFPGITRGPESDEAERPYAFPDIFIYLPIFNYHSSFLKQTCHFCIPPNPDLLAYWDRVEDRLFKIRNCMNFSGIRRQISLFAPEIDPRLLVRAKAAGLSLDDVLNSINGELPPYRFAFLLAKAKEYAGALQGFGGALLGALEKKSGEELALLQMRQQDVVLKVYTSKLKDMEVAAAEAGLEGLLQRQKTIQIKVEYYESLLDEGLIALENLQSTLKHLGNTMMATVSIYEAFSSGFHLFPKIIGLANSTGGDEAANHTEKVGGVLQNVARVLQLGSESAGIHASYKRREQGWKFSLQQSHNELKEIEPSLIAAEIRRDISIKSRELHEKSIELHQETYEFYRDKFTNLGLYTYLSSQLQRMYRESYQNAMSLARMAERAYRFERNDDTSILLDGDYWDSSRAGLMAGEKLSNALRRMELRYMETNTRGMEVDQAFSLAQIDPAALIDFKVKGSCEFTVPEFHFDLFYPGQYRRQIKSARLTIPCITGPYSNVSAVMTLKSSYIRKDPKLDDGNSELTLIPASRSTTVATSTAQNDSGVFRLDFRDERYMPFEGAGAVESTWLIELPKSLRPFDYSTINDCILHISYTAEYDTSFRESVEKKQGLLNTLLTSDDFSLPRIFSLRQEFSQAFHQLLHSPEETEVSLELSEKHFPLFLQGKKLEISTAKLMIELDENGFRNDDGIFEAPDISGIELEFKGNSNGSTITSGLTPNEDSDKILLSDSLAAGFSSFLPAAEPLLLSLQIKNAGDLAPDNPTPSDPSALDDHKIKDVYLLINYKINN